MELHWWDRGPEPDTKVLSVERGWIHFWFSALYTLRELIESDRSIVSGPVGHLLFFFSLNGFHVGVRLSLSSLVFLSLSLSFSRSLKFISIIILGPRLTERWPSATVTSPREPANSSRKAGTGPTRPTVRIYLQNWESSQRVLFNLIN